MHVCVCVCVCTRVDVYGHEHLTAAVMLLACLWYVCFNSTYVTMKYGVCTLVQVNIINSRRKA